MELAPIVLLTYKRPEHTRITLEYLTKCELADQSKLYVFCDGPKADASEDTLQKMAEVQKVLRSKQWTKDVEIFESKENKGLYRNVKESIAHVIKLHGKCICIEDDLKIGKYFLTYMNEGLSKYEQTPHVKQISGFMYPTQVATNESAFFIRMINSYGWATWERAWNEIDFHGEGYEELRKDKELRKAFNLNGSYDYANMLEAQMKNSAYGSWAILYWWSVFKSEGIVLFPDYSLTQHNDFDHTGEHASIETIYDTPNWNENHKVLNFPDEIKINEAATKQINQHLRKNSKYSIANIIFKVKKIVRKATT